MGGAAGPSTVATVIDRVRGEWRRGVLVRAAFEAWRAERGTALRHWAAFVVLSELLGAGWKARPPERIVAFVRRVTGDWAGAAEAYASLASRHPVNGRLPFYEGFSRLHTAEWGAALAAFRRAVELGQWSPWSRYYIAAAHAGAGETDAAWDALDEALELGFDDSNLLRTDPWWSHLREAPEYRAAMRRLTD